MAVKVVVSEYQATLIRKNDIEAANREKKKTVTDARIYDSVQVDGLGDILPSIVSAALANITASIPLMSLLIDGAATTGGQIGRINPAATVAGLGCVRAYHTASGVAAQTVMQPGAMTLAITGTYAAL